ncbi:MAG: HDIG domain-containing protein [Desulfobulbaceae bacterium]|nr:HDIG domain-containing protein [Desulfobulbaceae bacterium]
MLPNIRRHSVTVAKAALQILNGYGANGRQQQAALPDTKLVVAGALLHDIAKTPCLREGCDHARAGARICMELGFPEIARIVAEHVILKEYDPSRYRQGIFSAVEIIYYADKRVRHEEVVSLEDRLEYILEHYGKQDPEIHGLIRENFAKCIELEQYLFSFLDFSPGQLAEKVLENNVFGEPAILPGEDEITAREQG